LNENSGSTEKTVNGCFFFGKFSCFNILSLPLCLPFLIEAFLAGGFDRSNPQIGFTATRTLKDDQSD